MTSNTVPSGEASASDERQDTPSSSRDYFKAYRAFDKNINYSWLTTTGNISNAWVQYKFDNSICVKKMTHKNPSRSDWIVFRMKNFKIQASNDNEQWDTLYTGTHTDSVVSSDTNYNFNNKNYYTYYRLYVEDVYTSEPNSNIVVNELQFYGRTMN